MNSIEEVRQKLLRAVPLIRWKRLAIASVCFWVPVTIFAKIADEILERDYPSFDEQFLLWLHGFASPLLDQIVLVATEFGGAIFTFITTTLLAGMLWHKGFHRKSVFALISIGGAGVINFLFKQFFSRERPALWPQITAEHNYSFPSGHAMMSSSIAFVVILLLWNTRFRWLAVIGAGIYIAIIGFTRLYLGVHFPTDIVAGWCVSAAWVFLVFTIIFKGGYLRRAKQPSSK